jgi:hypothetical protein
VQWIFNLSRNQWNTLANDARNTGFGSIRITGFDCNALDMASSAAAAAGIKVLAGIYVAVGRFTCALTIGSHTKNCVARELLLQASHLSSSSRIDSMGQAQKLKLKPIFLAMMCKRSVRHTPSMALADMLA